MKWVTALLCITPLLTCILCQEFASDCPEPNGFFADAVQCDKYYACNDGALTQKLCPDGMVFNDLNPRIEKCDFPFHISCEERPELQQSQATTNCPRQNGYFPHSDLSICDQFFYCAGGIGSKITCPESLVFSLKSGTCVWPDDAGRTGCTSHKLFNFTCPKVSFEIAITHPRYPDPSDCQYFYVCINGDLPRHNGCKFGEVFNNKTKTCDQPINVPDCKDYYKEYFEQFFSNLESGSNVLTPDIIAAAIGSGFDLPDKPKRVKITSEATAAPPRRRKPSVDSAAAADSSVAGAKLPATEEVAAPRTPSSQRVPVRRRPNLSANDGQPLRRRKTTTTTTTTTEAPVDADYYYYDYPEAPAENTSVSAPK